MSARLSIPEDLAEFLLASAGMPFVWGRTDCALWVADWIRLRRGVDLGAKFRGTYDSRIACHRMLIGRYGGNLVNLAAAMAASAGLKATDRPQPGDVACCEPDQSRVPTMTIAGKGGGMFMKAEPRGIVLDYPKILAAWAVRRVGRDGPDRIMQAQRGIPQQVPAGRKGDMQSIVGGFVQQTTITPEGITTRIVQPLAGHGWSENRP